MLRESNVRLRKAKGHAACRGYPCTGALQRKIPDRDARRRGFQAMSILVNLCPTFGHYNEMGPWTLCVAPMMDWTDMHCRFFHRLLSPNARLYTEMVTAAALAHGDPGRLLAHNAEEHPVALQVGGAPEGIRTGHGDVVTLRAEDCGGGGDAVIAPVPLGADLIVD